MRRYNESGGRVAVNEKDGLSSGEPPDAEKFYLIFSLAQDSFYLGEGHCTPPFSNTI